MGNRTCSFTGCGKPVHTIVSGLCSGHYAQRRKGRPLTPIARTLADRFWAKVTKTSTCWLWTGATNDDGYGQLWVNGRIEMAHRVSLRLHGTAIPDGYDVDHVCRNHACVRPDPGHLEPVTHGENIARAPHTAIQWQRAKSHCPQQHEYTPENTRYKRNASGGLSRECRICRADKQRRYRERKRARRSAAA